MKRHIVPAIIAALSFGILPLSAQASGNGAPGQSGDIKVFAVNLSTTPVDLRLGDKDPVFEVSSLAPQTVSTFTALKSPGSWRLYYKNGQENGSIKNQAGQEYSYNLQSGRTYLVRFAGGDKTQVFQLSEPDTKNAKIAFINASDNTVGQIQVGSAFGQNTLVSMKNLPAGEHSNFGSINFAANYGIFWSSGANGSASLNDANGKAVQIMFSDGSYWVLLLSKDQNGPAGKLFKLNP